LSGLVWSGVVWVVGRAGGCGRGGPALCRRSRLRRWIS